MAVENELSNLNLNTAEFEIKDGVLVNYKGGNGDIVIPEGVKSVRFDAFRYCRDVAIKLPQSLTSDETGKMLWLTVFFRNPTYITVDEDNKVYKSIEGNLYSHDGKTLIRYASGKKERFFSIPEGVITIAGGAFDRAESLFGVGIPSSVTTIGNIAFYGCTYIESITIPSSVTSIGLCAFEGCQCLKRVRFEDPCDWGLEKKNKVKHVSSTLLGNDAKAAKLLAHKKGYCKGCLPLKKM